MKTTLFSILLFGSFTLLFAAPEGPKERTHDFELGIGFQSLMPSRLTQFENSLVSYGPVFGINLGGRHSLQAQISYGSIESFSLFLGEINYRFLLRTPFFTSYFSTGPHYLHYEYRKLTTNRIGGQTGLGFLFRTRTGLEIDLKFQTYLSQKPILSLGAKISWLF